MTPTTSTPPKPAGPGPRSAPARPTMQAPSAVTIDPRRIFFQYWPWFFGSGVVGLVLGVMFYFALLRLSPLYDGKVWFEFLSPIERVEDAQASVGKGGNEEIERFMGTQMEVMTSDAILKQAVTSRLVRQDTKWIKQFMVNGRPDVVEASSELADITSAGNLPDTNIVQLRVRTKNKNDAATLVNAIKLIFLEHLRDANQIDSQDKLERLSRRLNTAQEDRRRMEERMERLFGESGIESLDERYSVSVNEIDQLLPSLVSTQYSLELIKERLKEYKEFKAADGGPIVPEDIKLAVDDDSTVLDLKNRLNSLELAKRSARESLGPNHRSVKQIELNLRVTKQQLDAQRERLQNEKFDQAMELLRSQVRQLEAVERETLQSLEESRDSLTNINRLRQQHQTLQADAERLANEAEDLKGRIAETQSINERRTAIRVSILADGEIPSEPAFPKPLVLIPVVFLLTVFSVVSVIVLREALEQRVRGPSDVTMIPRTRVLGLIPNVSEDPSRPEAIETAVRDRPTGVIAECVRQVRSEIFRKLGRGGHKVLLVVGGMPQSGATSAIINLALSCAACDRKVLLIDANLRRPRLHDVLEVPETPGLSEVISGSMILDDAIATSAMGVDVLPAGATDSRTYERLTSSTMVNLLKEAREKYDLVLLDVAPAIVSSDAIMLAGHCDATVLVVRAMAEKRGLVARVRNQIDQTSTEFLGVIINGVRGAAGGYFRRNFRATYDYLNNNGVFSEEREPRRKKRRGRRGDLIEDSEDAAASERNGDISALSSDTDNVEDPDYEKSKD